MMNEKFGELCDGVLRAGRQRFGAMMGIVSHIHSGDYDVIAVSSETGIPEAGDSFALDAVYCREVFQTKRTVAITEVDGVSGMSLHPLYVGIPCEFYISAPIILSGDVWGTLNFTSLDKRAVPFSEDDILFIETQALRLSNELAKSA